MTTAPTLRLVDLDRPDVTTIGLAGDVEQHAFWAARPTLTVIRNTARERLVSPWATLGGVLAIVCTRVGPHVVLPPIVGSVASLNTFWAMVGASGGGKDAAYGVARELLWLDYAVPTHEVGTGQGIDSTYSVNTKDGPVQFCDSALFTISEIDTLTGHAKMSGSTIMATLRKVYSGAALGARYADKDKRRPVREHHYRAAVIAGVQPARSGILLGDADGGTPQRWLWLPTNDPGAALWTPPSADQFTGPERLGGLWQEYEYLQARGELSEQDLELGEGVKLRDRIEIKVCETARNAVIEHRRARLAGGLIAEVGDLTGHMLLTRLKVAALLAIFDGGRAEITEEDWQLSAAIMAVSDATRAVCAEALEATNRRSNAARALQAVERDDIAAEATEKRVAVKLASKLRRSGEAMSRSDLRTGLKPVDRPFFDSALERLINAGQVEVETFDRDALGRPVQGRRYRAASDR